MHDQKRAINAFSTTTRPPFSKHNWNGKLKKIIRRRYAFSYVRPDYIKLYARVHTYRACFRLLLFHDDLVLAKEGVQVIKRNQGRATQQQKPEAGVHRIPRAPTHTFVQKKKKKKSGI